MAVLIYHHQLIMLMVLSFKCAISELFNDKDFTIIQKVINKCENESLYSCIANRAAIRMERISNKDIPLFDGIILKKQSDGINKTEIRISSGVSRLRKVLTQMLNTHILRLDLTKNVEQVENEERARGGKFRISKKEKKHFWYTMMVLLGIFGLTGPIIMKALTLIAGKALIASKIALLMVGSVALKKIFANDKSNDGGVKVHTHTVPIYDEHDRSYKVGEDDALIYSNSL